jgi:hypothetical protein
VVLRLLKRLVQLKRQELPKELKELRKFLPFSVGLRLNTTRETPMTGVAVGLGFLAIRA